MPNKTSAKKALRQSTKRRAHNIVKMRVLKDTVKKYKKNVTNAETAEIQTSLSEAYKKLDKAAKTNLITKNKANRFKSRLSKLTVVKTA